jgi:hypothetical protein
MNTMNTLPIPNGTCWCGCGHATKPGHFWLRGHEKRAQRYLAVATSGVSTAQRLLDLGYGGGYGSGGTQLRTDTLKKGSSYRECGRTDLDGKPCQIIGEDPGISRHRADDSQHAS